MNKSKQILINAAHIVGQSAWVIVGFLLAALVVGWLLSDWVASSGARLEVLLTINALAYFLAAVFVVGGAAAIARESQKKTLNMLALRWARWPKYLKVFWLFVVYIFVSMLVRLVVVLTAGDTINLNQPQELGFTADTLTEPYQYVLAFVMLVILPPIFEEILFRGYLYGRLRRRMGFWVSAIATSLVFALVHWNWSVSIDVFVLSLFLCYLRDDSNSLVPAMLMHSVKNGLAYFLLFIAPLLGFNLL